MEFEFRKNFITRNTTVSLPMEQHAFAVWLEHEGQLISWVDELILNIEKLQRNEIRSFKMMGSEFVLLLADGEASVTHHRLFDDEDQQEHDAMQNDAEGLSFYNLEIEASCGLEDFLNLIESWREFIE